MAVDIKDECIGIALAYHRQVKQRGNEGNSDWDADNGTIATTSINPLPPLPYMSRDSHHPSYSFLRMYRPFKGVDGMYPKPERLERTLEVAVQLAQLSTQRSVKSILVRWPGDGAAIGFGGVLRSENIEWIKGVDHDLLAEFRMNSGYKVSLRDTYGYQRGRILHVLDQCCGGIAGHNASSHSLLMEGSRLFALWDTPDDQKLVTLPSRVDPSHQCEVHHSSFKSNDRLDKYGNSIAEIDQWGRAPIFGMPPVCNQKKIPIKPSVPIGSSFSEPQFDQFHDAEAKIDQLKDSFSAMLTLKDFAQTHLEGRVALPSWVKLYDDSITPSVSNTNNVNLKSLDSENHVDHRKQKELTNNMHMNEAKPANNPEATTNKYPRDESHSKRATLVQMPRIRRRSRSEQATSDKAA